MNEYKYSPAFGLIRNAFCIMLAFRFWSEYLDAKLGTPLSPVLTVQMILLAVAIFCSKRKKIDSGALKIIRGWWFFVGSAVVTVLFGKTTSLSNELNQVIKYVSDICVIFIVLNIVKKDTDLKKIALAIMLGMIPSLAFAWYQGITQTGFVSYEVAYPRAYGLSSHPVLFGVQIVILFSCLMLIWPQIRESRFLRRVFIVFIILMVPALYYTYARTAWVIIALGAFLPQLLGGGNKGKLIALSLVVFGVVVAPLLEDRFQDLFSLYDAVVSGTVFQDPKGRFESSMHWRFYNWFLMIKIGLSEPIVGNGPGVADLLSPYDRSSHSSLVDVFVEQGLVGVLMLINFALTFRVKSSPEKYNKKMSQRFFIRYTNAILILLGLSAVFSISLVNQTLNMLCIFLLIGLRYAIPAISSSDSAVEGVK